MLGATAPTSIPITGPVIYLSGNNPTKLVDVVEGKTWIPVPKKPLDEKTIVVMEKGTQFDFANVSMVGTWITVVLLILTVIGLAYAWFRARSKSNELQNQVNQLLASRPTVGVAPPPVIAYPPLRRSA